MIIKKNCKIEKLGNNDIYRTWLKNGERHRDGDYAMECIDGPMKGSKLWFQNGKCHREDGPAYVYYYNGIVYRKWYLNGKQYTKEAFEIEMNARNLLKATDKVRGFSKHILDVSI